MTAVSAIDSLKILLNATVLMKPNSQKPSPLELALEEDRLRHIRRIVDNACFILGMGSLSLSEAHILIAETRRRVLCLAPEDEDKFNLIYAPRLRRIAQQWSGLKID